MNFNFYKNKYFKAIATTAVLLVVSFQLFTLHKAQADPVTYYFNNAVNTSPAELGNYWYDGGYSDPALELPDFDVDQVFVANGAIFDGSITFNLTAVNEGVITGNATFNDTSYNAASGEVQGNATFYDSAYNSGLIGGNGFFHDSSLTDTEGTINGNATFYNDVSDSLAGNRDSRIYGTLTRHYTEATTTVRDFRVWTFPQPFIGDGEQPWTVVADGVVVDVSGATIDSTTVFSEINGGSFVGLPVATYYFNNEIDYSPSEIGNYWQDADCTVAAGSLPNFTRDVVFIVDGMGPCSGSGPAAPVIFDGDITFNGAATNHGTITGDAVFNDTSSQVVDTAVIQGNATFNDSSFISEGVIEGNAVFNGDSSEIQNRGSVDGTVTRYYSSAITTTRNFTFHQPWIVVADNAAVNLSGATFDPAQMTFNTVGSGSFVFPTPVLSSATARLKTITLTYSKPLDTNSTPSAGDFDITVNGISIPLSTISVATTTAVLTLPLEANLSVNDVVLVDYTPGVNPIRSSLGTSAAALVNSAVTISTFIELNNGSGGGAAISRGSYVYTIAGTNVKVVDSSTDAVVATIPVGSGAQKMIVAGNRMYVNNQSSNNVTAIDLLTNTVSTTISVGTAPVTAMLAGAKLYVGNQTSGTVSVINTLTNTVSSTITAGASARVVAVVGTKVYVANFNASSISVIDTLSDTVIATISTGTQPSFAAVIGYKLYVVTNSTLIRVFDTRTDTLITTIDPAGGALAALSPVGTKLYAIDRTSSQVRVINSVSDAVTATIALTYSPSGAFIVEDSMIVGNFLNAGTDFSIINTNTDTVSDTISSQAGPQNFTVVNSSLYISNRNTTGLNVINFKKIVSQLPDLVSFSTSSASGTYTSGQAITISANFARALQAGSTMTVSLNSGGSAVLSTVSGGTLSGTYTIASADLTPDLSVTAITSASVTDLEAHTRTSYNLPSSASSVSVESLPIVSNIGDTKNIVIGSFLKATTGANPRQLSAPFIRIADNISYLYAVNQGANSVSVIRLSDYTETATISVGTKPFGIALATVSGTTYAYVSNSGSNSVSVINTETNLVVATVAVGVNPGYLEASAGNIYVSNGSSNTVSVIDTASNLVTATISVGLNPRDLKALNGKLYVANYGDPNISGGNYISVISLADNSLNAGILLPAGSFGPYGLTTRGNYLYVANYLSDTVSVINSQTRLVSDTISVVGGPRDLYAVGSFVYVAAFDAGTLWAINPDTNEESAIVNVGHSPAGMTSSGLTLYSAQFQDNTILALNAPTNLLLTPVVASSSSGGGSGPIISGPAPFIPQNQTPVPDQPIVIPEEAEEPERPSKEIDEQLTQRLKGRILLAVQDRGKIWYIDPTSGLRYRVTLDNVLSVFRGLSLGITNENLEQIPVAPQSRVSALANRLKGRLLLQVQNRGVIWYVDTNGQRHLITITNVIDVFKKLSLGITNENLDTIKIGTLK